MANEEDECDFDLCEMCVTWVLECEEFGTDLMLKLDNDEM